MNGRKLFRKSRDRHPAPGLKVKVTDRDSTVQPEPVKLGSSPEDVRKHEGLLRKLSRYDRSPSSGGLRCNVHGTSLAVHSESETRKASRKTSFHAPSNHKLECEPVQKPDHVHMLDAEDAKEIKMAWDACSTDETMTYKQFLDALLLLSEHHCANMQTPFTRSLFDLFKLNDSDVMVESEFVEGIALLCVGTQEEKQLLTFQVFDTDHNGYIDMREMYGRCKEAFGAAVAYAIEHYGSDAQCAEQLAQVQQNDVCIVRNYVASVFSKYSHHTDHRLRYPEFLEWMAEDPEFTLQVNKADAESHCIWLSMTHSFCGHANCDSSHSDSLE